MLTITIPSQQFLDADFLNAFLDDSANATLPCQTLSRVSLSSTLWKVSFNEYCHIQHSQVIWLELILNQYFNKANEPRVEGGTRNQLTCIYFWALPAESATLDKSELCTLLSFPVELAIDISILWDTSRKFQMKDVTYELRHKTAINLILRLMAAGQSV